MKPEPVQHFEQPFYPTRRELLAGAATFALFHLTGCSLVFAESKDGKITVAPIFKHGEGRGADGCMVVSPPVFLSEEEALQIVKEELAKHGVQLASGLVLKDLIIVPRRTQQVEGDEKSKKIVPNEKDAAPLRITGMDEKRSIGIEFICEKNYKTLGGVDPQCIDIVDRDGKLRGSSMSSVRNYDFKDAAEYVATQVKKQGKDRIFFGVFYDPLTILPWPKRPKNGEKVDRKTQLEKRDKQGKEESEKLLRQQAQDFLAWLKEQKAIK